jgi:hypothetical protein
MSRRILLAALALVASGVAAHAQAHKPPKAPKSLRLYIFDCGVIHTTSGDAVVFHFSADIFQACP